MVKVFGDWFTYLAVDEVTGLGINLLYTEKTGAFTFMVKLLKLKFVIGCVKEEKR